MTIPSSRKKSPLNCSNPSLFLSLVDYRNNYFTSDDPKRIIEFYNSFENRDQLIQWMKERPKGVANIREVDGCKDIIVVIPTADFNGKYARECREDIFKGLHIIFVESGDVPDPYFNYAHNCNVGIKKAIEYIPKWVVVSNDDMLAADSTEVLTKQLRELDYNEIDSVFLNPPSDYYSVPMVVSKIRTIRNLIYFLLQGVRGKMRFFEKKFEVRYVGANKDSILARLLYKDIFEFTNIISFGIFSINAIRSMMSKYGYVYDETFINNSEDGDLSIRLALNKKENHLLKFKINPGKGGTLGLGTPRLYRDFAGAAYFSKKIENYLSEEQYP